MNITKRVLITLMLMLTCLALTSRIINANQENIQKNYQVFLQNQTFPSEYLNSFRDYVYKVNTVASFSIEEDAEFAQISRTQMTYTEDGKLSSTSIYRRYVSGVLILYSRYLYDYVDDRLTTKTIESSVEGQLLMSTSYENYFYDNNNLLDYISETDETGEIYRIEDYTYNDDALLVRIDYFDANNEYLANNYIDYLIYDYDDSFRLISKKSYKVFNDTEAFLRSQSFYTYNAAGLLSSITFGVECSDGTKKESYLYDENNVLIRIDYKQYENITYQLYYYLELAYDQNGNKIKEDKFSYASIPEGYFYTGYTTWTYQSFVLNSNVEIIHSNNLTNYPNPFNPETRISFNLKTNNKTSLSIYNLKGQVVKTFNVSNLKVGNNELVWHGKDNMNQNVSSGIYFIKLQNGDIVSSKKIVLMK